ncbi:MAG TPA: DciA family protein [Burkholderiaceae bacterium]|nr:DciA family protein [Burkholderiaceae bacterium]
MKPLRARHALDWLHAEPAFNRVGDHGRRMLDLQADVSRLLPSLQLTVVALAQDVLVVAAPSAAAAAKLRQHEPSLIDGLAASGWKVNRIRFKPQMRVPAPGAARRPPKPGLPAAAIADLDRLAMQMRDSPLKRALTNFARRQRRSQRGP